ncbi:MAG: hypothetical protein PVJ80_03320 [Gemmatimonadota bacterium]
MSWTILGFPGAADLGNIMQFEHDVRGRLAARDGDVARRLNPDLQTFSRWLEKHGSAIPRH